MRDEIDKYRRHQMAVGQEPGKNDFMNSIGRVGILGLTALSLVVVSGGILLAKPLIVVKILTYNINGSTVAELRRQMNDKGPDGLWGYTKWRYFLANQGCRVKVEIEYTLPKWSNKSAAPKLLRKKWDKFIAALKSHEKGHGRHAISAGKEIEQNRCRNHRQIADKWGRQDKIYDRETDHGTNTGVRLR